MSLLGMLSTALSAVVVVPLGKVRGPGSSVRRVPPEYKGAVGDMIRQNPHGAVAHHAATFRFPH